MDKKEIEELSRRIYNQLQSIPPDKEWYVEFPLEIRELRFLYKLIQEEMVKQNG